MHPLCPESGADLPPSGQCRDHFDALLALETEVVQATPELRGAAGQTAHFYAVTSYVLQHPESMGYTRAALLGARANLARHLGGQASLAMIRRSVRRQADGPARVLRRPGDPAPQWPVTHWPLNVADILAGGTASYCQRVTAWAHSIWQTLAASEGAPPGGGRL